MSSLLSSPLPYAQATASQRAQLGHYLQARLQRHFPTLPARAFDRTLAEFRPVLWFIGAQVTLTPGDLLQLVQYLGHSPELPLLDPPLFCRPALVLAQYTLLTSELTVGVLTELVGTRRAAAAHGPALPAGRADRAGPALGLARQPPPAPGHARRGTRAR
jgi:hypothetical protein